MEPLTYKSYNKTKLAIRGDMQYDAIIKAIGGRWNSRMKEGPGWTIDNDKEEQLKMLIQNLNMSNKNEDKEDDDLESEDEIDDSIKSGHDNQNEEDTQAERGMEHQFDKLFSNNRQQSYQPRMREERPRYEEMPRDRPIYNERPRYEEKQRYEERPKYKNRQRYNNSRQEYDRQGYAPREEYEDAMVSKYNMKRGVDDYYSRFAEKPRLSKNHRTNSREEEEEEEQSEGEYDSDDIESLSKTISALTKHVDNIRKRSRGRKHRREGRRGDRM